MRSLFAQLARDPLAIVGDGDDSARRRPKLRYLPDLARLPESLQRTFSEMRCDAGTAEWITGQLRPSRLSALVSDVLHAFCLSRTSANGLCQRGGMFVFSTEQAMVLLGRGKWCDGSRTTAATGKGPSLLDIGAGDGGVTSRIAPLFAQVSATEHSKPMQWLLRRRGFAVLGDEALEATAAAGGKFDVVSCLNVLDRCDAPWTLLRRIRALVKEDGGLVLLAVVLPFCPFVEAGNAQRAPTEILPLAGGGLCREGARFEQSLALLHDRVLVPAGFEVVRWARLPYLSEGNAANEFFALDDAVLVLRPV